MKSKDLFLSAEERYQVWCIKVAERPELLELYNVEDEKKEHGDNGAEDGDESSSTALEDGCDISGWRRHKFASKDLTGEIKATLRVGSGCTLLRNSNQLPVLPLQSHNSKWLDLQRRLATEPLSLATPIQSLVGKHFTVLESLDPIVLDYEKDLQPLYPNGQRTWNDPPPSFEVHSRPALIQGCTVGWRCMETMKWNSLMQNFGGTEQDLEWRFSDTHGHGMTLHTYQKYCNSIEGRTDDAPLAIYDSQFHLPDDPRSCLVDDFTVPSCFSYDIFSSLPEEITDEDGDSICVRPPYQWILMGPERSGTGLHVDPIGTHAWVTLIEGCKRWVLFHPDTPAEAIGFSETLQLASVVWFEEWWCGGKVQQYQAKSASNGEPTVIRYVEFLQQPGETIYVPAGWPHLVLNLKASVALTQNYATEQPSLEKFWRSVQSEGTPIQRQMLLEALQIDRPDLVEKMGAIDAMEGKGKPNGN